MANLLVVGTQWGDEGKGKIIDLLTPAFDIVARYQGGHNAGHTVYVKGKKIILHLIPSGILHPGKLCVIGNGVVLHPQAFLDEITELKRFGLKINDNIVISKNAHLILPYHSQIEKISEERRGAKKIGTTCRGIGPTYEDKAGRCGLRAGDLLESSILKEKIEANVKEKNLYFKANNSRLFDAAEIFKKYKQYASQLKKYITDVSFLLNNKIKEGKTILFEGAQGTLLDVDHGTYPYVTSSNSSAGGVCTGLGISPDKINSVLGVTKAYTTRVGGGPFPTEIFNHQGKFILERGNEFGATTGRPRRCGWFDALAVSYACRINGICRIALTKSDVLDGLMEISICVGYKYKGQRINNFPTESWILDRIVPVYKTVKGWSQSVHKKRDVSSLPQEFKDYVKLIEDLVEAKVVLISTGMEKADTIFIEDELRDWFDLGQVEKELH